MKSERSLAAVTPVPRARPVRPTPTFISKETGLPVDPKVENKVEKPDDTIPWADATVIGEEKVAEPIEVAGTQNKVNCGESLNAHPHIPRHHCSPQPAPHCHSPRHSPYCRPALGSLQLSPGVCRTRCGIAPEPAMCGSAVVMFEQAPRLFVDDCQLVPTVNHHHHHHHHGAGELVCSRCRRPKKQ